MPQAEHVAGYKNHTDSRHARRELTSTVARKYEFNSVDFSSAPTGSGSSRFVGAAFDTTANLAVYAPNYANCVGTFSVGTSTFNCVEISSTITGMSKFEGAAFAPATDNLVVFAPYNADCVGSFSPATDTFRCVGIPSSIRSMNGKFSGAAFDPTTSLVVMAPNKPNCAGTFNPATDAFRCVDISSTLTSAQRSVKKKFSGAAVHPTSGLVYFAPHKINCIGIFTPATDTFRCVGIPSSTLNTDMAKFDGVTVEPTSGLVVFVPRRANCVGIFTPATDAFRCVGLPARISGDWKFSGGIADPTSGLVVFAPYNANCVGVFSPANDAFRCVDISSTISWDSKFHGATVDPATGLVVFPTSDNFAGSKLGTFSITACDSAALACPTGKYRDQCGTTATGVIAEPDAIASGVCSPCTNGADGETYTSHGGVANACPTAAAALSPPPPSPQPPSPPPPPPPPVPPHDCSDLTSRTNIAIGSTITPYGSTEATCDCRTKNRDFCLDAADIVFDPPSPPSGSAPVPPIDSLSTATVLGSSMSTEYTDPWVGYGSDKCVDGNTNSLCSSQDDGTQQWVSLRVADQSAHPPGILPLWASSDTHSDTQTIRLR